MKKLNSSAKIAHIAIMTAISIIFSTLIRFPLLPSAPFLEYDLADVPILIIGFMYGPISGVTITTVVCLIQGFTVSAGSGPIGVLMHFIATSSFVFVASLIYKKNRTLKGAILGLFIGVIIWMISMVVMNIVLTPIFLNVNREFIIKKMLLQAIIPFNLIKSLLNSFITLIVYKRTRNILNIIHRKNKNNNESIDRNDN